MSKERNVLASIIKLWAQEHDSGFQIASSDLGDQGINNTGAFFSWLIKETDASVNLLSLLDRLEEHFNNINRPTYPDGMFCRKCQTFYKYAEPNQDDGTLLCFSCKSNPYS